MTLSDFSLVCKCIDIYHTHFVALLTVSSPNQRKQVFCICFMHIDAVWTQRNAVRTDFGSIIGE